MHSQQMQTIGICRFSYPAIGGFQVEHDTIAARQAFLYDPARLEHRFRYFETFTLPCLKAQTDSDFTFLVVIGEHLPKLWHDRLMDGLSGLQNPVVQRHAPGPHRQIMKQAINSVRKASDTAVLQFRMDDDDAVNLRFVERLRLAAQDNIDLIGKNRHVALDFNQGYVARPGPDGIDARAVSETLWTPALGMTSAPGAQTTIMNFGHSRMARFMPVLALPAPEMFVRGHSDMNDSRQKASARPYELSRLSSADEARFQQAFAINSDAVRQTFSFS